MKKHLPAPAELKLNRARQALRIRDQHNVAELIDGLNNLCEAGEGSDRQAQQILRLFTAAIDRARHAQLGLAAATNQGGD